VAGAEVVVELAPFDDPPHAATARAVSNADVIATPLTSDR